MKYFGKTLFADFIMVSDNMMVECYKNPIYMTSFPGEEIVDLFLVWWV
jgi:hypothetical protein